MSDRVAHLPDFSRTVADGAVRSLVSEPIAPPTRLFGFFLLILPDLCLSLLASRLAFAITIRPGTPYIGAHAFCFYVPFCLYAIVTIACFGASGLYRGVASRHPLYRLPSLIRGLIMAQALALLVWNLSRQMPALTAA